MLKIKTLEHFQTELEGNQVDYTTKPKPYDNGGKNDIRHRTEPYQEGIISNIIKNQTQQQKIKNTETNTTNSTS